MPAPAGSTRLRGNVAIAVVARRPQVRGPIAASAFNCPASRMAWSRRGSKSTAVSARRSATSTARAGWRSRSLTAGDNGLANLVTNLGFKGTPTDASGAVDLAAQRARLADDLSPTAPGSTGKYRLQAERGPAVAMVGRLWRQQRPRCRPGRWPQLIEPLGRRRRNAARADRRGDRRRHPPHRRQFRRRGPAAAGQLPRRRRRCGSKRADASGPSGARVEVAGGDGVTYYWPSGRIRIDGDIAMAGGGLPTRANRAEPAAQRRADERRGADRALSAPATAGWRWRRCASPPARDGSTSVSTRGAARRAGPGRLRRGLRMPIDGQLRRPGGGFAFGRACIDARFASFQHGRAATWPGAAAALPDRPAIVSQAPGGALQVGARDPQPRLQRPARPIAAAHVGRQGPAVGSERFAVPISRCGSAGPRRRC